MYDYDKIHIVCYNGVIKFGKSLSQSSEGRYEYAMNLIDAQIYLLPICLQIKFRDKRKKYIIMMEKLEDYKYMIRTLKVQKQEKFREKEMYLCDRIKYLHRVQANHVAQTTKLPCRHLYKYILEDARKTPAPSRHSGHYLHLKCLARRKSLVDCICYYTCWC